MITDRGSSCVRGCQRSDAMRAWLDQVRLEPSRFTWKQMTAKGAVVRVHFEVAEEAVIFAEHFLGRVL